MTSQHPLTFLKNALRTACRRIHIDLCYDVTTSTHLPDECSAYCLVTEGSFVPAKIFCVVGESHRCFLLLFLQVRRLFMMLSTEWNFMALFSNILLVAKLFQGAYIPMRPFSCVIFWLWMLFKSLNLWWKSLGCTSTVFGCTPLSVAPRNIWHTEILWKTIFKLQFEIELYFW